MNDKYWGLLVNALNSVGPDDDTFAAMADAVDQLAQISSKHWPADRYDKVKHVWVTLALLLRDKDRIEKGRLPVMFSLDYLAMAVHRVANASGPRERRELLKTARGLIEQFRVARDESHEYSANELAVNYLEAMLERGFFVGKDVVGELELGAVILDEGSYGKCAVIKELSAFPGLQPVIDAVKASGTPDCGERLCPERALREIDRHRDELRRAEECAKAVQVKACQHYAGGT